MPAASPAPSTADEPTTHNDIVIIGAGMAGINTAYRLQTRMPHLSFTILDTRKDIGGCWDLFRYPGVRSDSDMYTYGFEWHPWRHKLLGSGEEILSYLHECVKMYDLDKHMNFEHKVLSADWSSETQRWNLRVNHDGKSKNFIAKWLVLGTGLFDHENPFPTVIPGLDNFQGKIIHPQFWPQDYDYTDKKIVIIGSGATAVTLLPALVKTGAKHVTMLQRSPAYILPFPIPDAKHKPILSRILPARFFHQLLRLTYNYTMWIIAFSCKYFPSKVRETIAAETRKLLPAKTPFDPHFVPKYSPWAQRMCYAPDSDFFLALQTDEADVVTGTIKTVTENGISLDDGMALDADIIVTATGFSMSFAGNLPISVDGQAVEWSSKLVWNGSMIQDVPNMVFLWGYPNMAWTLGADEAAVIMCRLLKYMESRRTNVAVPGTPDGFKTETQQALWKLSSTYVLAAQDKLPRHGTKNPWKPRANVFLDLMHAYWGNITKGLQFLS